MTRQQSPYTGRYKKSAIMGSPQNPFQRRRRLSDHRSSNNLISRYPLKEPQFLARAFRQACIIIVAGTILVSLLSVAIPPVPPTNTRMAAPRPINVVASGGAAASLRANVRKRGGVRSQSLVRTINKKENHQSSFQKHHWDAETLEHDGDLSEMEASSSEEQSPSKQHAALQLKAQIESKANKQNAAAEGVFGRTQDEHVKDDDDKKKKRVETTKTVPKGHVKVQALDSSDKDSKDEKTIKDVKVLTADNDNKSKGDSNESSGEDAEKKLEKSPAKLSDLHLEDKSVENTSEGDTEEEKNDVFGKDDATIEKERKGQQVDVDVSTSKGVSNKVADGDIKTDDTKLEDHKSDSRNVKEHAEKVNASLKEEEKKAVEVDEPSKTHDVASESDGADNRDASKDKESDLEESNNAETISKKDQSDEASDNANETEKHVDASKAASDDSQQQDAASEPQENKRLESDVDERKRVAQEDSDNR